jgi:high-affinity nickel permease
VIALLTIMLAGFFLGMRHATDPDHVIAVTTIVTRQKSVVHASLIGILWGIGHTITIFVIGTAIICFSVVIPTRVGLSMELSVGLMLILLGVLNLTGTMRWMSERFTPQGRGRHSGAALRDGFAELEPQVMWKSENHTRMSPGWLERVVCRMGLFQTLRPLLVGIVHGLAGSAAVALLVLTTIRNPWWALAYLLVFGFGTVAGMMLITSAIAMPIAYSGKRFSGFSQTLTVASGVLSIGFGCFLAYQIGVVNGLLTSHPRWTPR